MKKTYEKNEKKQPYKNFEQYCNQKWKKNKQPSFWLFFFISFAGFEMEQHCYIAQQSYFPNLLLNKFTTKNVQ